MSIEKIKQRIKMIEDNDFSTINEAYQKPGQFDTQDDFDAIMKSTGGTVFNKLDPASILNKLGSANSNSNKANSIIKNALSGSNTLVVGDLLQLPTDYESYVFPIYKLLKKYNILTDDLDDTTFDATVGYKPEHGRNFKINNKLVLQSSREIEFLFYGEISSDSDMSTNKLSEMSINLSSFESKSAADITNFINELTTNKTSYKINNITNISGAKYLIKFN
jgi:hypothetical protein